MRKLLTAVLLGALSAGVASLLGLFSFVDNVELRSYDRRVRWTADPATASRDIVVVEINEDSLRRLEPLLGRWPWPRVVHADVIDFLASTPARVIGYDVLLTEADRRTGFDMGGQVLSGRESDDALAESTREAGMVVHLADATFEGLVGEPAAAASPPAPPSLAGQGIRLATPLEVRPSLEPPFPELLQASRAIGHNYLIVDEDGPVRRTVPLVRVGDRDVPSLAWAVAMVARGVQPDQVRLDDAGLHVGPTVVPLVQDWISEAGSSAPVGARRVLIRYQGPPVLADGRSTTYPTYSFYDLFYARQQMLAGEKPFIDPGVFRDKIVLVGVTAAGLHDVFATPFAGGKMAGPHVHAHAVDNLITGRFTRLAPTPAQVLTVVAGAWLVAGLTVYLSPWLSIGLSVGAGLALGWLAVRLFAAGWWLPVTRPLIGMGVAVLAGVAYQYMVEGREKRRVKRLFARYVSPGVFQEIMANPALAGLGGRRRTMTVLFSDIRGFTAASEAGEPEAIVAQLNEYFTRMVGIVFRHRGTVDKFVGDMVMALFGAPLDDSDHADHAVAAALDMVDELARLNAEWGGQGRPRLDIGIGISSGEMIAGNIGSDTIMSYTVIGDTVNLGARLESLNKEFGTRIIMSEATRSLLRRSFAMRPLGEVVVKGKSRAVEIHEVLERHASAGAGPADSVVATPRPSSIE